MYRLAGSTGETRFLKLTRTGWIPSACAEAERLRWLRSHVPVPDVLDAGTDDDISWVLTAGLRGRDATHSAFRSDTPRLVTLLARGLRAFHEIPPEPCPFQFRLDDALRVAHERLEAGRIDPVRHFHREYEHLSASDAVAELVRTRPVGEDLVVCHGDYCLPNILIDDDHVVGYVDVGELGVADRWWDLAVATWSVTWNLGPGLEAHFLNSYGIAPDDARIRFYRLLYDVVS
jgi:kanamycin kinase